MVYKPLQKKRESGVTLSLPGTVLGRCMNELMLNTLNTEPGS